MTLLKENPEITTSELANKIGVSEKGIEWHILRMKQDGLIRRVGPDKGGRWEVL